MNGKQLLVSVTRSIAIFSPGLGGAGRPLQPLLSTCPLARVFDDLTAAEAAFVNAAGQTARADADAHVSRWESLPLTEHAIIEHPAPPRFKFTAASSAALT